MLPDKSHQTEIERNHAYWQQKPLLHAIYRDFYTRIAGWLAEGGGLTVELGSGIGAIREVIPHCVRTEIEPNPWVDQVENAYALSFGDGTLRNLILFDVFHHLRHPGLALREAHRVLQPGGRVIIFEPCVSLLGRLVYGLLHEEPLALDAPIEWLPEAGEVFDRNAYYAAQGNAFRIFIRGEHAGSLPEWGLLHRDRLAALSYVASGGYSRPQLYPERLLPLMRAVDRLCDRLPSLFATRLLVVLERN